MAHYDLYQSIGLDRSHDCAAIAQEIDGRLASGITTNPGGVEELHIARAILGDPQRRGIYDQKMADPTAPDINIAALRDLANLQFGGAPQPGQAAAPQQPHMNLAMPSMGKGKEAFAQYSKQAQERLTPAVETAKSEIARSSKGVIAATAAITALVMLLIGAAIVFANTDRDAAKAKDLVNEFLDLRTNDEAERWLIENALAKERQAIMQDLEINEGFSGVDTYFKVTDPKAGDAVNMGEFLSFVPETEIDEFEEELEINNADDLYVVLVKTKDSETAAGSVWVLFEDGKPKLAGAIDDLNS
ncbi:hypothetical protein ACXIUA_00190 [Corynebacterium sp. UMB8791]